MRKKIKNEAVGIRLYSKCNKTVLRMEEPGCMLRAHYVENEFYRRISIYQCRCFGRQKKYFQDKKYLLADRISQN